MTDTDWDTIVKAAEDSGYGAPAPLGTYVVRVESAEAGESRKKRTPQISLKLKIIEGPYAGKRPTTMPHTFWKTEGAAGMFIGNLAAFGITTDALITHRPTLAQLAAVMEGKTVTITTKNETGEFALMQDGTTKVVALGVLKAPPGGAVAVTEFPAVAAPSQAPAGGFSSDPGF